MRTSLITFPTSFINNSCLKIIHPSTFVNKKILIILMKVLIFYNITKLLYIINVDSSIQIINEINDIATFGEVTK